jgi:hypothetical protein
MIKLLVAVALILITATPVFAASENRCGWFENPTPANMWLDDRDGEWTVSVQGGYHASGVDVPDFGQAKNKWVVTNGSSYGYGCACIRGHFDRSAGRVIKIEKFVVKTLAACRADRSLNEPRPG